MSYKDINVYWLFEAFIFNFLFSFHITLWFYHHPSMGISSRDPASRLSGFKFWLHHTHLVSENTLLDLPIPVSSSKKSQEQPPHGVVEGCWACVCKVLRTVPGGGGGGWRLYPQVSHSCSARFPWQIYQTSDVRPSKHLNHGNSAKGHGSFCCQWHEWITGNVFLPEVTLSTLSIHLIRNETYCGLRKHP